MLPLLEDWPACPGCGSADLRPLHVMRNTERLVCSPFVALIGCQHCGLAYTAPRPSPETLAAFYDRHTEDGWRRGDPADDAPKLTRKHAAAAAKLGPLDVLSAGAGRRALDFGCGAGALLDVLQDAGWETFGIEPAATGMFAGRRHRMIESVPEVPTFDLAVLHHVLEHVLEPGRLMRQIAAACRPGARLLVGVPSLEAVAVTGDFKYACSHVHINAFTREGLANVLRVNGWRPDVPMELQERTRIVMYGTRLVRPEQVVPDALHSAVRALRGYGQRLTVTGVFTTCPLSRPGDVA